MSGPRFCGSCGRPLPDPTPRFCTECGAAVGGAPVAASQQLPPAYLPAQPAESHAQPVPPRQRRWWPMVLGVGVVVVVVVGGLVAFSLLRGDSARSLDGSALPKAVTSEPEEQWSYDYSGSYLGDAVGTGDLVVLADEDGDVVAVDADGEEAWATDEEYVGSLYDVPGHDVVLAGGGEGGGFGAFSTDDGEELWWDDDQYATAIQEDGVLLVTVDEESPTSELSWADAESGETTWSVDDVESFIVDADSVYVVVDETLQRLDQGSGDVTWSVDLSVPDEEYVQLAASDSFVAVGIDDEVTAYDVDGGDELWEVTADDEDGDLTIGTFSSDRVYLAESVYDDESETTSNTVVVRDADGEVGDIPVDDDSYFYGVGVESGGTSWFVDLDSGELYDEDVERAAQYDGDLTLADRGVYAQDGSELDYYEYGEGKAAWNLDLPSPDDESLRVLAVDDGVLVSADGELTLYR